MLLFNLILLLVTGSVLLSLAMPRHYRKIWHRQPNRNFKLLAKTIGWLCLLGGLLLSLREWGAGIGSVTFLGVLTLACMVVAMMHTFLAELPKAKVKEVSESPAPELQLGKQENPSEV